MALRRTELMEETMPGTRPAELPPPATASADPHRAPVERLG